MLTHDWFLFQVCSRLCIPGDFTFISWGNQPDYSYSLTEWHFWLMTSCLFLLTNKSNIKFYESPLYLTIFITNFIIYWLLSREIEVWAILLMSFQFTKQLGYIKWHWFYLLTYVSYLNHDTTYSRLMVLSFTLWSE